MALACLHQTGVLVIVFSMAAVAYCLILCVWLVFFSIHCKPDVGLACVPLFEPLIVFRLLQDLKEPPVFVRPFGVWAHDEPVLVAVFDKPNLDVMIVPPVNHVVPQIVCCFPLRKQRDDVHPKVIVPVRNPKKIIIPWNGTGQAYRKNTGFIINMIGAYRNHRSAPRTLKSWVKWSWETLIPLYLSKPDYQSWPHTEPVCKL